MTSVHAEVQHLELLQSRQMHQTGIGDRRVSEVQCSELRQAFQMLQSATGNLRTEEDQVVKLYQSLQSLQAGIGDLHIPDGQRIEFSSILSDAPSQALVTFVALRFNVCEELCQSRQMLQVGIGSRRREKNHANNRCEEKSSPNRCRSHAGPGGPAPGDRLPDRRT